MNYLIQIIKCEPHEELYNCMHRFLEHDVQHMLMIRDLDIEEVEYLVTFNQRKKDLVSIKFWNIENMK
jgi:hypothetical protein